MSGKSWKHQPAQEQLLPQLEQWFCSEPGQSLLAEQRLLFDDALKNCFGYHLLQLSVSRDINLSGQARVQSHQRCHPLPGNGAQCEFDQLPIATSSLDAVILHHAHEFVSNPHFVLREMERVIVPHGHLLIAGFNPWSLLGLYAAFASLSPNSIWHNHRLGSRRLTDWLALLGFKVIDVQYGFYRPPISNHQLFNKFDLPLLARNKHNWPFGAFYVISAVKEVATMTPVKTRWQLAGKSFGRFGAAKPSTSSGRTPHRTPETLN